MKVFTAHLVLFKGLGVSELLCGMLGAVRCPGFGYWRDAELTWSEGWLCGKCQNKAVREIDTERYDFLGSKAQVSRPKVLLLISISMTLSRRLSLKQMICFGVKSPGLRSKVMLLVSVSVKLSWRLSLLQLIYFGLKSTGLKTKSRVAGSGLRVALAMSVLQD